MMDGFRPCLHSCLPLTPLIVESSITLSSPDHFMMWSLLLAFLVASGTPLWWGHSWALWPLAAWTCILVLSHPRPSPVCPPQPLGFYTLGLWDRLHPICVSHTVNVSSSLVCLFLSWWNPYVYLHSDCLHLKLSSCTLSDVSPHLCAWFWNIILVQSLCSNRNHLSFLFVFLLTPL